MDPRTKSVPQKEIPLNMEVFFYSPGCQPPTNGAFRSPCVGASDGVSGILYLDNPLLDWPDPFTDQAMVKMASEEPGVISSWRYEAQSAQKAFSPG